MDYRRCVGKGSSYEVERVRSFIKIVDYQVYPYRLWPRCYCELVYIPFSSWYRGQWNGWILLGLPGSLIEVTEWLVGISGHFLNLGVHHVRLLRGGRNRTENRGRRRCFSDVEMVGLQWRSHDSIGTVVDREGLIWRQCRVGVLEATGETLATTR